LLYEWEIKTPPDRSAALCPLWSWGNSDRAGRTDKGSFAGRVIGRELLAGRRK